MSVRGPGAELGGDFLNAGALVVCAHDEREGVFRLVAHEQLGVKTFSVQADMSAVPDIERLFAQAMEQFGQIDIVVANTGIELINVPFVEITEDQFDRQFGINTEGTFFTLQAAARHVVDNGRIISIGSSTAVVPFAGQALYGSSKVAPHYVVGVAAQELADRGVTVNTIMPTGIEGAGVFTEPNPDDPLRQFIAQPGRIGRRMGTVDDVADAAEYLASDLAAWVSGQGLVVTGGALQ
ncbi:SDR family NAD(P)-dependent oxidoreductase [Streptomyces sp. R35]|uniref:SDR family NAD(P)-dependent oxidoreductase n=1 Tax=Streptomyces sp. R35 TaxID=3238630 RepID=A0AB39S2V3_9ACTN